MSFEESVTTYRSVYFHFLDGLLNTKATDNVQNVIDTLNSLMPNLLPSDINFVNLEYRDDGYIVFHQLNNRIKNNFFTDYNKDFKSFLPDMLTNMEYYLDNYYFDFCLIDGIDRDVCCYNVLSKLKKTSIFIC